MGGVCDNRCVRVWTRGTEWRTRALGPGGIPRRPPPRSPRRRPTHSGLRLRAPLAMAAGGLCGSSALQQPRSRASFSFSFSLSLSLSAAGGCGGARPLGPARLGGCGGGGAGSCRWCWSGSGGAAGGSGAAAAAAGAGAAGGGGGCCWRRLRFSVLSSSRRRSSSSMRRRCVWMRLCWFCTMAVSSFRYSTARTGFSSRLSMPPRAAAAAAGTSALTRAPARCLSARRPGAPRLCPALPRASRTGGTGAGPAAARPAGGRRHRGAGLGSNGMVVGRSCNGHCVSVGGNGQCMCWLYV